MRNLLTAAAIAFLALGACGDDDDASNAGTTSIATETTDTTESSELTDDTGTVLDIEGFAFDPEELVVGAGAEVSIDNADGSAHTVTADEGEFTAEVGAEDSGTITAPDESGTYTYFCSFHPYMTGSIVVQ